MEKETLEQMFKKVWPHLGERERRMMAASHALALGHGGITIVSSICGLSRVTITKGIKELEDKPLDKGRVRKPGSGRPTLITKDPDLLTDLTNILEETTRGDPESTLLWTFKSTRKLSAELARLGHKISHFRVGKLLKNLGYRLQGNKKTQELNQHKDRNKQFLFINRTVKIALKQGQPVLSVDTKKKELIGNYKNPGRQWLKSKNPKLVNGHDFATPDIPKATPYGIYDIGRNDGFVNIGTNHDTASFAVASIRGWWYEEGQKHYNNLKYLLITADGGGSNGYRLRLWKYELQGLANEIGVPIKVCHFPPGTSKWNKVEHKLFSFISSNWRGEPLVDYETVVNLISHTTTAQGLSVQCRLDHRKYEIGRKVTDDEMKTVKIKNGKFHGEWNYKILPFNM
jgi:transposase